MQGIAPALRTLEVSFNNILFPTIGIVYSVARIQSIYNPRGLIASAKKSPSPVTFFCERQLYIHFIRM